MTRFSRFLRLTYMKQCVTPRLAGTGPGRLKMNHDYLHPLQAAVARSSCCRGLTTLIHAALLALAIVSPGTVWAQTASCTSDPKEMTIDQTWKKVSIGDSVQYQSRFEFDAIPDAVRYRLEVTEFSVNTSPATLGRVFTYDAENPPTTIDEFKLHPYASELDRQDLITMTATVPDDINAVNNEDQTWIKPELVGTVADTEDAMGALGPYFNYLARPALNLGQCDAYPDDIFERLEALRAERPELFRNLSYAKISGGGENAGHAGVVVYVKGSDYKKAGR